MYCSDYRKRAEQAVGHYQFPYTKKDAYFHERYCKGKFKPRKINNVKDLFDAIEKRQTTEKELRSFFDHLCSMLEPPCCQKSHCQYHTAFSFCNCADGRVPGKCKDHREYIKRRKARQKNKEEKEARWKKHC
jgi:hypothetical protein